MEDNLRPTASGLGLGLTKEHDVLSSSWQAGRRKP
jgi:hypothetical protein